MIYVFFQSLLVVLIWHKHVLYSHKLGFVNVDLKSIVVKTVETLRTENKKLRDENGALIRVISKLSRWDESPRVIVSWADVVGFFSSDVFCCRTWLTDSSILLATQICGCRIYICSVRV